MLNRRVDLHAIEHPTHWLICAQVPVTFEDQLRAICRTPSAATLNRAAGRPAQTPSAARLAAPTPTANPLHDAPPPPGFREIELREVEAPGDLRVRSPSTERKEAPREETKAPEAPDDHGPLGRRPRAGGAAGCVSMIWFVAKAPFAFVCYYGGLPALRRRGLWEALALAAAALIAAFSSVWKSTSAPGAPNNSSPSHFSAMTRSCWLGRAVGNRHRHAIEQASCRWRGGRRDERAVKF